MPMKRHTTASSAAIPTAAELLSSKGTIVSGVTTSSEYTDGASVIDAVTPSASPRLFVNVAALIELTTDSAPDASGTDTTAE